MAGQQVPSVGRVVHYVAYGSLGGEFPAGVCRAADITEVDDPGNPDSARRLMRQESYRALFQSACPS